MPYTPMPYAPMPHTPMRHALRRRTLMSLAAVGAVLREANAQPLPATLLVAGPPGGRLDRWAELLALPLARALARPLKRQPVGGIDGVTGANAFQARVEPDGNTAMLLPGTAATSWLVGESRARFEPARWVPLWAGATSSVLVSRVQPLPGRPLLVAASGPAGPELPAFLALDLMGIDARPAPAAQADAMLLAGPGLLIALAAAQHAGMQPVFTFGPASATTPVRDEAWPTLPSVFERLSNAPPDLLTALRAAATAVQLEAGLMLPALTPAASISQWRRACAGLAADPELLAEAARLGVQIVPDAAACAARLAPNPAAVFALRRWLAARFDWQPA